MAILLKTTSSCCLATIRSSAESSIPPEPRQTKVVLPDKKPLKWSTGIAPGDYGGPPTTSKLRKYWGGKGGEDPVTSTDDFIWNKEFLPHMQRVVQQQDPPVPVSSKKESSSGFLSLSRAMNLDSMDIDLSTELSPSSKSVLEQQVEAARVGHSLASDSLSDAPSPRWKLASMHGEQARWDRVSKATIGGTDAIFQGPKKIRGDPKALAGQAGAQYSKLKKKLQLLTLGIGSVGVISAYISYSSEVAVSFATGVAGSLMYIRMLGNGVESIANGAKGVAKGAAAQPRLLVPVALVMIYSRWNAMLVPNYGFMHLDLIPMLVGFFTYKFATFAQAIEDSFLDKGKKSEK